MKNNSKKSMAKSKKQATPKKRGGPRAGAGAVRKPIEELKEAVTLYIKKSTIKQRGGKDALKKMLTSIAESNAQIRLEQFQETTPAKNKAELFGAEYREASVAPAVDKKWAQGRIKELEDELKSPPKTPLIGIKNWIWARQSEIDKLKEQLK